MKYNWEDYSASIECDCGEEIIITDERTACSVCGRTYTPYWGIKEIDAPKKELIPTDVEIFGYKNVDINQVVTSTIMSSDTTNWCVHRVQLNMDDYLIIDFGKGRQIRIKFRSNRTNIGV